MTQALKAEGCEARGFAMDVSVEEAVNDCFAEVKDTLGPVDVLVSNAGIQKVCACAYVCVCVCG